jgi:cytoskeletal protein CcmA (bactofilin family)
MERERQAQPRRRGALTIVPADNPVPTTQKLSTEKKSSFESVYRPKPSLAKRLTEASKIAVSGGQAGSTIGVDFTINGDVKCNGEAKLDGNVEGNVECLNLVVGENGRILGNVTADSVVVFGRVHGNVYARKVTLKSTAQVEGDVFHNGLSIDMGATFLGASQKLLEHSSPGVKIVNGGSKA